MPGSILLQLPVLLVEIACCLLARCQHQIPAVPQMLDSGAVVGVYLFFYNVIADCNSKTTQVLRNSCNIKSQPLQRA